MQRDPKKGSIEGVWRLELEIKKTEDSEYLTFGTWLSSPDSPDGRYDVGTFADGSVPFKRSELVALMNNASYEGQATGLYVKGEYGNATASGEGRGQGPMVENAQAGSFVATTELTAKFGDEGEMGAGVSGTIENIKENGESLGNWRVVLNDAGAASGTLFTGSTAGEADGRRLGGQWGVGFFRDGKEKDADDAETKMKDERHPGYAAGTFSASTRDENTPQTLDALHLIGAFGAKKVENK